MITDLTYPIHEGMFKYPSDPEVEVRIKRAEIVENAPPAVENAVRNSYGSRGAWEGSMTKTYKSGNVEFTLLRNHHGTHVDAPSHKIEGGNTIAMYNLHKFINKACLVDLTEMSIMDRGDRAVVIEDIKGLLDFDRMKEEDVRALVFYTGFCDRMRQNEGKLIGKEKTVFEKTFPYFTEEAARYIADSGVFLNIAGIDSFSFDPSGSNSECHRAFFQRGILLLETLVNLADLKEAVKESTFKLYCVPLLYKEGDAGQARAYAETGIRQGEIEP